MKCIGSTVVPPLHLGAFVENKLYSYSDDSNLVAVVPFLNKRVAIAESLNQDRAGFIRDVTFGELN